MTKGLVGLVALLAVTLAGCGTRIVTVEVPGEAVKGVLEACKSGDYAKAALYWKDGQEAWERSPEYMKGRIGTFCNFGRAADFSMDLKQEGATLQVWRVTTYADQEQKKGLQMRDWTFERTRGGDWVLVKVE
ncbi:MAG TPA: hypothetical protein VK191_15670 [Symbiobacteriaceae bacterium]|nr:hypothetical protein [Symbiobacteriaceae bacterium]